MKKISLKKTPFDTYAFSALILLASLFFLVLRLLLVTNEALFVYVYIQQQLIDKLPLNQDRSVTYLKEEYSVLLADVTIEIQNNKVRVEKETSKLNYCSIQGFVDQVGQPVICAPNSFYLQIMGESYAEK